MSGAAYIYREQQERYLPIKFSVRERDLGGAIQEAQQKVALNVPLPPGSRVEWVGEFGNLQDAIKRLSIVVPISLALIAMLIWFNFGSVVDTILTMSVIPMAVFGGILGLLLTGIPFSVSAAIGFVALSGVAVLDDMLLVSCVRQLLKRGQPLELQSLFLEPLRQATQAGVTMPRLSALCAVLEGRLAATLWITERR